MERSQWLEEQEALNTKLRCETTSRVAELEAALDEARREHNQALSAQAEELNLAFEYVNLLFVLKEMYHA